MREPWYKQPWRVYWDTFVAVFLPYLIMIAVLLLIGQLVGCAHQDEWTRSDTRRQWAVTGLMVIDAHKTAQIQYDPRLVEGNPIPLFVLGTNPSTASTYQYFATLALSQFLITRALPARWRPYYQCIVAIDHLYGIR